MRKRTSALAYANAPTGTRWGRRTLTLLLSLVLCLTLLPGAAFADNADTGKAIQIGTSQIKGGQASSVYFGKYQQSSDGDGGYNTDPIKWRVLSNADGKLFLLADQNLDVKPYNSSDTSITWKKSTICSWLNGYEASENDSRTDYSSSNFIGTAFSSEEQGAIAQTDVHNASTSGGNDTNDKIFLLSVDEANSDSYFPNGNDCRKSTNTAYVANYEDMEDVDQVGYWWLRSPGINDFSAAVVSYNGNVFGSSDSFQSKFSVAYTSIAVRPAFNLNTDSVLFVSAAAGGKSDTAVDKNLTAVTDYDGSEWKLTLKDSSRSFSADVNGQTSASAPAGGSVQITYTGARTGENEYVSVLLCDSNDNVLYYGNIAQSSASGTASVAVPADLAVGSYTIKVFSEQCSGDKKTDYASDFQNISLTVEPETLLLIYTAKDLKQFRDMVNAGNTAIKAKLMADVDLAGNATDPWTPIDNYTGTFDGGTHTITLGKLSAGSGSCGLFAALKSGAFVKDLTVTGTVSIENPQGHIVFGAIAGSVEGGATLLNCCSTVDCASIASNNQISYGGLVGTLAGVVLNSMYNNVENVQSESVRNGIAATCEASSTISNCYASAPNLIGSEQGSMTLENSYTLRKTSGSDIPDYYDEKDTKISDITSVIQGLNGNVTQINGAAYWTAKGSSLELMFFYGEPSIKIADDSPTKDTLVKVVKGEQGSVTFKFEVNGVIAIDQNLSWFTLNTSANTLVIDKSRIEEHNIENGSYTLKISAMRDYEYDDASEKLPYIEITVAITDKHEHDFAWTPDSDRTTHTGSCQHTGCMESKTEPCADSNADGKCDACGKVLRSSSTGGSYTPSYTVTVEKSTNGSVSADRKNASSGATVTITVTPDSGYTLETLTVTDKNGSKLTLTDKGDGRFTFTMPSGSVTVRATFMDDNTLLNFFVDVKASDYYARAVLWAAQNGITSGTDAVHFSPDAPCTRAQIVTFLWRAAGSPVVNYAMNMTDVPADAYYAEAVRWALSEGIAAGTTASTFSPDAACTRAQAVAFVYRYAATDAATPRERVSGFTDADDIPAYALPAMNWALGAGVLQGSGSELLPNDSCTRAQIVTFLYRALAE